MRVVRSHWCLLWVRAEVRGPDHPWGQYQGYEGGEVRDREAKELAGVGKQGASPRPRHPLWGICAERREGGVPAPALCPSAQIKSCGGGLWGRDCYWPRGRGTRMVGGGAGGCLCPATQGTTSSQPS